MSTTDHDDASEVVGDFDGLRADVTEHEDGPDECTIWPHNASGSALLTEWITAEEGSFVSLGEMR